MTTGRKRRIGIWSGHYLTGWQSEFILYGVVFAGP